MVNKIIKCTVFILLFFSCKDGLIKSEAEFEINLEKAINENSEIFPVDISYIFLETRDDILIGSIDKLYFVNDKVFVMDSHSNAVYCFDETGKFIYKIARLGKGPGEYLILIDFYVDSNENVFVYDINSKKILVYQNMGVDYYEIKVDSYFLEFVMFNDDVLLCRNLYSKGLTTAALAKINLQNNNNEIILKPRKIFDDLGVPNYCLHSFFKSETHFLYYPRFTNKIISLNKDEYKTKISFINKDYFPDKNFVNSLCENGMNAYFQDRFVSDIYNIYENDNYILFNLILFNQKLCIFNKNNEDFYVLEGMNSENYFGRNEIIGLQDGCFVSLFDNELIFSPEWIDRVNNSSLDKNVKESLVNYKAEFNPVLIKYNISNR